jgi:hypothetical protein
MHAVHQFQDGLQLTPLSQFGSTAARSYSESESLTVLLT